MIGEQRRILETTAQELEALRQQKQRQWGLRLGVGAALMALAFVALQSPSFVHALAVIPMGILPIIGLLGFAVVMIFVDLPRRQFKRRYKEQLFSNFLKVFGELSYSARGQWSEKKLYQRRLVPPYEHISSEDHFTGIYKDVGVHLSEVLLEDTRHDGQKTRMHPVFKGLFIELTLPRPVKGKVVVVKDYGFLMNKLTGLRQWGLQRITLEDPQFESLFEVYGDDQIVARTVLTPVFMERLASLLQHFKTSSIAMIIDGAELFMAVPYEGWSYRRNRFEAPSLHRPITPDTLQDTLAELLDVLRLIDVLKLG